jgi:hypothetical protein
MELLALYIAVIALLVAIPGTIDATWNVILKLRALKKGGNAESLKKISKLRLAGVRFSYPDSDHIHPASLNRYTRLRSTMVHELAHAILPWSFKKNLNDES